MLSFPRNSTTNTKIWIKKQGDEYTIFDATFYRNSQGFLILELEPTASQENIPFLSFYHLAQASINRLEKSQSLRDFSQIIVQEIRKIIGGNCKILVGCSKTLFEIQKKNG